MKRFYFLSFLCFFSACELFTPPYQIMQMRIRMDSKEKFRAGDVINTRYIGSLDIYDSSNYKIDELLTAPVECGFNFGFNAPDRVFDSFDKLIYIKNNSSKQVIVFQYNNSNSQIEALKKIGIDDLYLIQLLEEYKREDEDYQYIPEEYIEIGRNGETGEIVKKKFIDRFELYDSLFKIGYNGIKTVAENGEYTIVWEK